MAVNMHMQILLLLLLPACLGYQMRRRVQTFRPFQYLARFAFQPLANDYVRVSREPCS